MANKYDLKTWKIATAVSGTLTNIGGTITDGKTRFLTYLRVENVGPVGSACGTGLAVLIGSQTAATTPTATSVSAGGKLPIRFPKVTGVTALNTFALSPEKAIPAVPSIEHPILSVTGSGWMSLIVRSGPSAGIFAEYYDE